MGELIVRGVYPVRHNALASIGRQRMFSRQSTSGLIWEFQQEHGSRGKRADRCEKQPSTRSEIIIRLKLRQLANLSLLLNPKI